MSHDTTDRGPSRRRAASDGRPARRPAGRRIGLLLLISALLAGPARAALPPDMERIVQRGRLVVALYAEDMPPFFMKDARGELTGVDVDLARTIGRHLGVETVFDRRADSFDGVVEAVARGEADIGVSMLSVTLDRARRVLFSRPYAYLRPTLLMNRLVLARDHARDPWRTLRSPAVRIGVVRGSSYVGLAAERFPEAVRVLFPDSQALLAALKQGRVQAIFQSEAFMEKILAEAPALSISHRLLYLPGHDDRFACVLPWTSVHFWKWLNTTLEALDASPDSGGLWRKYDRNRY